MEDGLLSNKAPHQKKKRKKGRRSAIKLACIGPLSSKYLQASIFRGSSGRGLSVRLDAIRFKEIGVVGHFFLDLCLCQRGFLGDGTLEVKKSKKT